MIKRIFFKLLLASLPVLAMAGFYLYADPFLVLYHYDEFHNAGRKHFELNEDYATTENFLKMNPKDKYNAFILGSSRSRYFSPEVWAAHLPGNDVRPYYFGVAAESLFGIAGKLKLLDETGSEIRHALLVTDAVLYANAQNSHGHLFIKHPAVSGESRADFQFANAMDFFDFQAMYAYMKLPPASVYHGYKDVQMEADEIIARDPEAYFGPKAKLFYKRPANPGYTKHVIQEAQVKLLKQIKNIFDKHHTDYKVVISPMYDQQTFDTTDMRLLTEILGREHIYDFSGVNAMTKDLHNYYEPEHYRPVIANQIMDICYPGTKKADSAAAM